RVLVVRVDVAPDQVESIGLEEVLLLDVRKNGGSPPVRRDTGTVLKRHGEASLLVVVRVQGQPKLLEIVAARHTVGRFPYLLDRRQKQADQHGDDGDDDEELNQRESLPRQQHTARHQLPSAKDTDAKTM